jgi:hypothetical protein
MGQISVAIKIYVVPHGLNFTMHFFITISFIFHIWAENLREKFNLYRQC